MGSAPGRDEAQVQLRPRSGECSTTPVRVALKQHVALWRKARVKSSENDHIVRAWIVYGRVHRTELDQVRVVNGGGERGAPPEPTQTLGWVGRLPHAPPAPRP